MIRLTVLAVVSLGCLVLLPAVSLGEIPSDGLVAHYPFLGDFEDASGNDNHATPDGGGGDAPTFTEDVDGHANSACLFDHYLQLIELPADVLDGSTDFTFSAWVKFSDVTYAPTILSGARSGYSNELLLFVGNEQTVTIIKDDNQPAHAGQIVADQWYGLTWVRHGASGASEIYIDRPSDAVPTRYDVTHPTGAPQIDSGGLWLGNDQGGGTPGQGWESNDQFLGVIDEVFIYNRALSEPEARQLHIPEPATLGLLAVGGLGLLRRRS